LDLFVVNCYSKLYFFKHFISIYNRGFSLSHFHLRLQCTLVIFIPSNILSTHLCPLKTIYTNFAILFSYMHIKYMDHIHSPSPFPFILLSPNNVHSLIGPVLHSSFSFLSVYSSFKGVSP
jgi:hypothetical protein